MSQLREGDIYYCPKCGSDDIGYAVWYDIYGCNKCSAHLWEEELLTEPKKVFWKSILNGIRK